LGVYVCMAHLSHANFLNTVQLIDAPLIDTKGVHLYAMVVVVGRELAEDMPRYPTGDYNSH